MKSRRGFFLVGLFLLAVLGGVFVVHEGSRTDLAVSSEESVLRPWTIPFHLKTWPPWAAVFIDGEYRGQTPFVTRLNWSKRYALSVRLPGYVEWSDTFVVTTTNNLHRWITLTPLPTEADSAASSPGKEPGALDSMDADR